MPIRILLADDHLIVRQGVRLLLEKERFQVVAEAGDGHEAIRLVSELQPDVAVVDLEMPRLNGLDVVREIARTSPKTRAIILTRNVWFSWNAGMRLGTNAICDASKPGGSGF